MIKVKVVFDQNSIIIGDRRISKSSGGYDVVHHKGFGIFNINLEVTKKTQEEAVAYCMEQSK